jgi:hypothetical protein
MEQLLLELAKIGSTAVLGVAVLLWIVKIYPQWMQSQERLTDVFRAEIRAEREQGAAENRELRNEHNAERERWQGIIDNLTRAVEQLKEEIRGDRR